ncbi:MAG: MinD/ParA family protein, partial [Alteromonadaceae bacterium TMED7]
RKQTAIVDAFPSSPASVAIGQLATKALTWPIPAQPGGHLEFFVEQLIASKVAGR